MEKMEKGGFKEESRKICLCCIQYKITKGQQTRSRQESDAEIFEKAMESDAEIFEKAMA